MSASFTRGQQYVRGESAQSIGEFTLLRTVGDAPIMGEHVVSYGYSRSQMLINAAAHFADGANFEIDAGIVNSTVREILHDLILYSYLLVNDSQIPSAQAFMQINIYCWLEDHYVVRLYIGEQDKFTFYIHPKKGEQENAVDAKN